MSGEVYTEGQGGPVVWILEQRRLGTEEWEPCGDSLVRLRQQDFDQGLFVNETFSRYEFRATPYVRALQPPPPITVGPLEPPKPPKDRRVS